MAGRKELAARLFAVEVAERRRGAWQVDVKEGPLNGTWLERGIAGSGLGSVLDQLSELSKAIGDREAMCVHLPTKSRHYGANATRIR